MPWLVLIFYFLALPTVENFNGLASCSLSDSSISDAVQDVMKSVQGIVGNLQDLIGDKKGCKYRCPNGSTPRRNFNHVPSSNGCGAFGIQFDSEISVKSVSKCCDRHDICYDTCNKEKEYCDDAFKVCLESTCKRKKRVLSDKLYKGCMSTADVMYAGTVALGCKPYKDAQENACKCDGPKYNIEL